MLSWWYLKLLKDDSKCRLDSVALTTSSYAQRACEAASATYIGFSRPSHGVCSSLADTGCQNQRCLLEHVKVVDKSLASWLSLGRPVAKGAEFSHEAQI